VGLCASELDLFQEVLGPDVKVEREEHILAGARRCRYRIQPLQRGRRHGDGLGRA
jgi:predicted ArsR family transcriptional regulator